MLSNYCLVESLFAKPLYSYRDEQGINVITDNYDRIPAQYRARVTTIEQEADRTSHSSVAPRRVGGLLQEVEHAVGRATIMIPGLTPYQSHALTVAGVLAVLCFALRQFSSSQVLRFLGVWGLIMLGIVMPALLFFSQDGPLDRLRGQASQIQTKQLDHLKHAQSPATH